MLRSILALTVRHFFRNFYYSAITLGSLALGITVVIFLVLWDRHELGYDRQDPDADRVYTILANEHTGGRVETNDEFSVPISEILIHEIPEVERQTRIDNTEQQLTVGKISVRKYGIYADTSFFKVFPSGILEQQNSNPFPGKQSIAISDVLAKTLFGTTEAVGKYVLFDKQREYAVTSVFRAYPDNNSFWYVDYVLPYDAIPRQPDEWVNYYVKLHPGASKTAVEEKLTARIKPLVAPYDIQAYLFCLTDWRLRWNFENGVPTGGRITYVIIFNITAAFILLMACVNYVNLSTARASRRAREIGVRKVTGGTQRLLIRQFLTESVLMSVMATMVSILLVFLLLPMVRDFTTLQLEMDFTDPGLLIGLASITLFTGLIAGSYPAFLLSSLRPALVLKGNFYSAFSGAGVRKALVAFQFSLSVGMIFVALMMWKQTDFLLKREVGYDKHNVINVWMPTNVIRPQESVKEKLVAHPAITAAAFGGASPMEINGYSEVKWSGMPTETKTLFYGATVDFDMIPALGMRVVQGRNFSHDFVSDSNNFVINKMAADMLGFENPVGQRITYTMFGERTGEIVGVINDFNNDDIHLPIAPVVLLIGKSSELYNLFVRYEEGQLQPAMAHLKNVFSDTYPGVTFNHSFLDDDFETQMHREIFLGKISIALTVMAIIISVLGLLGLTLFSVERRTKEVGIRKVLGASVPQVMVLFFREFIRPALIAFAIGFPMAYYFIQQYLENFAYKVPITAIPFIAVGLSSSILILLVVSFHSYKAAISNPVDVLKTE